MTKWVYSFCAQKTDGGKDQKDLLGGKGANLAEMCSIGMPVPPGFTVTTEACLDYYRQGKTLNQEIKDQITGALEQVESITQKKFGDPANPLLFSVRSGARVSMPGMMDTVLNLGLNDETVAGIAKLSGDERFAWDSYRRFIQMYTNVVLGIDGHVLESTLEDLKEAREVSEDTELTADDLKQLVSVYKRILMEEFSVRFPQDPHEQIWKAIGAVFDSWNNDRAIKYRDMNGFGHDWGTAVNIQSMVFGNRGETSGTGVCFTRNPSTGEKVFFGEYLVNAQGEDVVAGIRTPRPINEVSKNDSNKDLPTLEEVMPEVYTELTDIYQKLETHYRDMQDIEFTVEMGKLFILQTRNGKRTTAAAIKIAVDLVEEGVLNREEAVARVEPESLNQLLHPRLDPTKEKVLIAKGLPASPGAATGQIVFDSETAVAWRENGQDTILVRQETSPEDIAGMNSAAGVLTARGGMTSHAAVVARGMGKPCVAGCSSLVIDEEGKKLIVGAQKLSEGDHITLDGGTGEVYLGAIPTIEAEMSGDFSTFMSWADDIRTMGVRTNADNPHDAGVAIKFGAEGIGLCRTEHMFFAPERVLAVREMIFAETRTARDIALKKLLPYQKSDFLGIFQTMNGLPVNIRLLDPPLHEFLPTKDEELEELARVQDVALEEVRTRKVVLEEFNPMLGHRGCRLGVSYPELYTMQASAIAQAACEFVSQGGTVNVEIMIPLVSEAKELELLRKEVEKTVMIEIDHLGKEFNYKIGTMIELPRAALTAKEIAKHADFFSFGTNDLTQTTYGLSRDDAGKFLPEYTSKGIYPVDPFVSLDPQGVGFLVKYAVEKGKETNRQMHMGICGEHGGEPKSIDFCQTAGLDYVSCSPYRVPIARLACAQAKLKND